MECCDNKNIGCKNYENICINCRTIYNYQHINEISFRDYNMNISNTLFYKKQYIKGKNICIIYVFILEKSMKTLYYFSIIHWKILENYVI